MKNHLYVFPSMVLVTLPRILGLTYFTSQFMVKGNDTATTIDANAPVDPEIGYVLAAAILLATFIIYSVALILTVFCLSRKRHSIREIILPTILVSLWAQKIKKSHNF